MCGKGCNRQGGLGEIIKIIVLVGFFLGVLLPEICYFCPVEDFSYVVLSLFCIIYTKGLCLFIKFL